MTLRSRLFAAFVAVVAVPLLVGLALLASSLPRAAATQQERTVAAEAALAAQLLAAECARARAAAEAAGRAVLAVPAEDVDAQTAALRSLVDRGLAEGVHVSDGAGRTVRAGTVPDDVVDCASGRLGAGPLVAVARLQQSGTAQPGTAVAALRPVAGLVEQLRRTMSAESVVLLAGDRVVTSSGTADPAVVRTAAASDGPVQTRGHVAMSAPVAGTAEARLVVVEPVTEGVDVVRTGLLVVLGAVLLAAALARVLARATTRPLEELGDAAARVASGDLDTTIEVRSRDEVGLLAGAFNAMTDELRDHVGQLQASRDELRAGLARLGETLSSTHDLERILGVVLETAIATTAARAGVVLLVDPTGSLLDLAVARGLEGRAPDPRLRIPVGDGVLGRVASEGEPLHGAVRQLGASAREPAADTVVAVPLRGKSGVLGVLALYDVRGDGDELSDDLLTLRTLADQAAVAVENVLLHRDVTRLAVTDGLTGLANYRSFTETIAREIDRASRFGRPVALLLLDIDHFKQVNDTHGHQRGDAVLVELAGRIVEQVRDVDTVARYGGEELVVVLPETDEEGAEQAAERIRVAVAGRPFGGAGQEPVTVTVSLGVAVHRPHGGTAASLLRRADEALYAAKRAGRNAWRTAPPVPLPGGAGPSGS
ncbi:MAG TPA: diguanylate cyclase [Mycobacteriales bacterium]|nr:diguanylate cyclase [Mycobacteriales bacterium]